MHFYYDCNKLVVFTQSYMGATLSHYRQGFSGLISRPSKQLQGNYRADCHEFSCETYAPEREAFDEIWATLKALVIGTWSRDQLAAHKDVRKCK